MPRSSPTAPASRSARWSYVTVIEVALIVSVMLAAPPDKAGLARDTIFSAVMIVCNGIVGLCLLCGGPPPRTGIPGSRREHRAGATGRSHHPHHGPAERRDDCARPM